MLSITALLIAILSFMAPDGGAKPVCQVEKFEDRSAVYTCVADNNICTAWVDAETQRFAGLNCR